MSGGRQTPWVPATKGFQPLRNHRFSKNANLWLPVYTRRIESSLNRNLIHVPVSSIFRADFINKRIIHTCRTPLLPPPPEGRSTKPK